MSASWRAVSIVLAILAVAAVGVAGWTGYAYWRAVNPNAADTVAARDEATGAARQLAVTLQTVDPARPEDSMRAWEGVATGPLLDRLGQDSAKYLAEMKKSPSTSSARAVEAALTELDAAAGTATAITALDVTQSPWVNGRIGPPSVRQLRVKLTLQRTDAGWKVASSGLVNAG
jgi:Mce-associated membrane protein